MERKDKKKLKRLYIIKGMKNALICDCIAVVVLIIIASIYSVIKHASFARSVYMSFYYGGAAALLIAVPQFYKRNEKPELRKIRKRSPLFGFADWFSNPTADAAMMESFKEFQGDGFWLGMMVVVFSLVLFALAVILENIFFV